MNHRFVSCRRRSLQAVALTSVALLVVACGSESDAEPEPTVSEEIIIVTETATGSDTATTPGTSDDVISTESDDEELAFEFAECMRDEGIDWPDPVTAADGSIDITGGVVGDGSGSVDVRSDNFQSAIDECGSLLDGASFLPNGGEGILPETQDQFLDFAECLRDEGVDVDDPDFGDGGRSLLDWEIDLEDPTTAAAINTCRGLFTGAPGAAGE
jgi:ABC-type glycerol-3-phosphate transport system substrate-binding protein